MNNTFLANITSAIQGAFIGRKLWALIGFSLLVFLAACSSAPAVGTLQVNITGLPSGVNASVKVTGTGFSQDLTATQTLSNQATGSYTVTAASVSSGGVTYIPTVSSSPATVAANATSTVIVTYAISPASLGSIVVSISGVPIGGAANVSMTGPGGFSQTITNSTTVGNLVPGSYTFTVNNIPGTGASANFTFGGTVVGSPANVIAESSSSVNINYFSITGALNVTVPTLPPGVTPEITVSGPNGFSRSITTTTTLPNLVPGVYTINASNLRLRQTIVDAVALAMPSSITRIVLAGENSTSEVNYAALRSSGELLVPTPNGLQKLGNSELDRGTARGFFINDVRGSSVALDRVGRVYVALGSANSIAIFDSTTSPPTSRIINGASTGLNQPTGMAFDSSGSLWVANMAAPLTATGDSLAMFTVAQLAQGGNQTPSVIITSSRFSNPTGLAFDRQGRLWVSNAISDGLVPPSLVRFSTAQLGASGVVDPETRFTSPQISDPFGLAFDPEGTLWVADVASSTLLGFGAAQLGVTGQQTPAPAITLGGLIRPRGLAFDNGGNLWVASSPDSGPNAGDGVLDKLSRASLGASGTVTPALTITGLGSLGVAGIAFSPAADNLNLPPPISLK